MKTVQLGRTGEQVSQLALGCMIMGTVTPEDEAVAILDRYAEAGGGFLDTADCYAWWERRGSRGGESEELIGRWLARTGRREDVFLATKGSAVPPVTWTRSGLAGLAGLGGGLQDVLRGRGEDPAGGDRRQPAPARHRPRRPVLRPRRRPGHASGGDAGGARRDRQG
ncbi:aldo/keto reductase [Nonomuraea ferruginea]